MIPVTIAKVQGSELFSTVVVLVDKQKERAIPFRYSNQSEQSVGFYRPLQKNAVAEPLTIDLIINIIRALDGTIEEIEIDTLQKEIIYARLHLRGQDGEHFTVNTQFNDALPLAVRFNMPISIAEELMDRSGIYLAEKGESWEQQLEAVVAIAIQAPYAMNSQPPITTKPRNLDFTQSLTGWQIRGGRLREQSPFDIQVDPQTLYQGQPSLHIKFHEIEPSSQQALTEITDALRDLVRLVVKEEPSPRQAPAEIAEELSHEGFLADEYRGKRVRMVAYCKISEVKSACFRLSVSEPNPSAYNEVQRMVGHSCWAKTLPIEGTGDWQRQEIVMEIPENARKILISFNFSMHGKSSIWLSGIQFAIVDESVPLSHFEISSSPSQPQNIDFQQGLQYWEISSSTPQDYDYGVEQESNVQGMRIAYIKALKEKPRNLLTLKQYIKITDYVGKRVRLIGRLRVSGVAEQANLYLSTGKSRIQRSIEGTQDWMPYEMTLFVPDEAISLDFGLTLHGRGQVWLQGLMLAVVEDQT